MECKHIIRARQSMHQELQSAEVGYSNQHDLKSDILHMRMMMSYLKATRQWAPGDSLIDFGGNDGTAAMEYRQATGGIAYCSEVLADRVDIGMELYPEVTFLTGPMEAINLPDKSVDWGFTVQALEHVQDLGMAVREMGRILRKGLYAALPLEDCRNFAEKNKSHFRHTTDPMQWKAWIEGYCADFVMLDWAKQFNGFGEHKDFMSPPEITIIFSLPGNPHHGNPDVIRWYDDMSVTHE